MTKFSSTYVINNLTNNNQILAINCGSGSCRIILPIFLFNNIRLNSFPTTVMDWITAISAETLK